MEYLVNIYYEIYIIGTLYRSNLLLDYNFLKFKIEPFSLKIQYSLTQYNTACNRINTFSVLSKSKSCKCIP